MKRVFLYAYDRNNLGDDLFVHTILRRYPDVVFYMRTDEANKTAFASHSNIRIIPRESKAEKMLGAVRPSFAARYRNYLEARCDAVVYIGGSIFIEYPNWEKILTWWNYEAENRAFYVLGANFGPYTSQEFALAHDAMFARAKDVCLRDRWSHSLFSKNQKVRYAPDILFGLPMPKPSPNAPEKKRVFISVIDCEKKEEGINRFGHLGVHYTDMLISMIRSMIRGGYAVTLASFCKEEGDEQMVQKLLAQLPQSDDIQTLFYDGTNADELLQSIADSSLVVASRFHAAILGFAAGKPVLPLVYSDKTRNVLKDAGFEGVAVDIRCDETVSISDIFEHPEAQLLKNTDQLKTESMGHFRVLDQLLGR